MVHSGVGLLIHSSCVISYGKVKRTLHLRFIPAYKALVLAMYWLLHNKWAVYCKCSLAVRLCIMYSSACIVNAVSPRYYTFTLSKVSPCRRCFFMFFMRFVPPLSSSSDTFSLLPSKSCTMCPDFASPPVINNKLLR